MARVRLLLVGREPETIRTIESALSARLDVESFAVVDSNEALRRFDEARPDVIVLNVPDLGPRSAEQIRSLKSQPKTRNVPLVGFAADNRGRWQPLLLL